MADRPYQKLCVDTIIEKHQAGVAGQLINIPTSAGKTRVASRLPYRHLPKGGHSLFIVAAEELVWQARKSFATLNPDYSVGVEKAEYQADLSRHDITIASIQTLATKKRLAKFRRDAFDQIGIDECHGVKSGGMFHDVLRHFCALKSEPDFNPNVLLYGLTATTGRSDGVGLEHTFSEITFQRTLLDLMRDGIEINGKLYPYIADIVCHRVDTCAFIGDVPIVSGFGGRDFKDDDLKSKINTPERNRIIVDAYLKLGQNLPAFAWTVDIEHSTDIVSAFNAAGIPAAVMSGSTGREERQRMFAGLDDGSLKVVASTGVLREGVDREKVTVGLMCRPHKAALPFIQKSGRIVRPSPAPERILEMHRSGSWPDWIKEHAILIDFVDDAGRHAKELVGAGSLFGLQGDFDFRGDTVVNTVREIEKLERQTALDLRTSQSSLFEMRSIIEKIDLLRPAETPREIQDWTSMSWEATSEGRWSLSLNTGRSIRIVKDQVGMFEVWWHDKGMARKKCLLHSLRAAIEAGDRMVPPSEKQTLLQDVAWRKEPPGELQCSTFFHLDEVHLKKQGHKNAESFYLFAAAEFARGNLAFSKGMIATRIKKQSISKKIARKKAIANNKQKRKSLQ